MRCASCLHCRRRDHRNLRDRRAVRLRAERRLGDGLRHRHRDRPGRNDDHDGRQAARHRRRPPTASALYLSDQTDNALVVIDLASASAPARVKLGDSPEGIYLSPDGRWLSAAIEENNQVLFVDTATLTDREARHDEGQEPRARGIQSRRPVALRERRGSGLGRHRRRRARRGREVAHRRRAAARHRLPARRQPRIRRGRARRHACP